VNIAQSRARSARHYPDHPALVFRDCRRTLAELDRQAWARAAGLKKELRGSR